MNDIEKANNEAVYELVAHIEKLEKELKQYRWIPISERLPVTEDGYAHVMVSMDDEFVCNTDYIDGEGFELWEDSGEVIAWMPTPEPYTT